MEVNDQFMNLKFDEIKKYGLHDTEIDNVEINDGTLIVDISSGVFYLDSFGKELAKSKNCKIIFEIGGLNKQNVYEHLEIFKKRKNTVKEIKFDNFKKLLNTNIFSIDGNYYSDFNNSILLKGFLGKFQIEITIFDIDKISINFD